MMAYFLKSTNKICTKPLNLCFLNNISLILLLSAKNPPVITQHPQSCIIPEGHLFSLRVEVLESPVAYQWYKDGFLLVGETRPVLNFQPFHYRHEGNYGCRVENSAGDALSNIATLEAACGGSFSVDFYQVNFLPN